MAHKHSVYDTDPHFIINPYTRAIKNDSTTKTSIIQHDHNSERFTFEIPRFVDGHDMSLCNLIQVHYINIETATQKQNANVYEAQDVQIFNDNGEEFVIFSWLISQNATQLVGSLNFLIRFICVSGGGVVDYVWNTGINSGISVSNGMNNTEVVVDAYPDVLAQWRKELFEAGGDAVVNVNTARDNAIAEIEAKGVETVDSIPDDYTDLSKSVDKNAEVDSRNSKRITNLEHGFTASKIDVDDTISHVKDVPEGAPPFAEILSVGGMTYKEGNVLRSAPVTEVKSVGANMATLVNGKHNLEDRINLTINNGHWDVSTAVYEDFRYDKWKPYTTLFLKAGTYNFSLQNRSLSHDENVAFELMIRDLNTDDDIASILFRLDRSDNTDFVVDKDKEVYIASYVFNGTGQTASCSFDIMISKGSGRKDFTEPIVHTLPIPAEVQALDGYGEGLNDTYYNYVSWNADGSVTFNKVTKRVELTGKEDWALGVTADSVTEYNRYICYDFNSPFATTKHCSHFDYLGDNVSAYNPTGEGLGNGASGSTNFSVDFAFRKNGNMPTLDSWKAYLAQQYAAGVPVTVEFLDRDTGTEVIDISDLISKDNLIGVESGGAVTFVNEHGFAVPSKISCKPKTE